MDALLSEILAELRAIRELLQRDLYVKLEGGSLVPDEPHKVGFTD